MSAYTTREAVRLVLARDLDKVSGTAASLTDEAVDNSIAESTATVNTRLGARYTVPFADPVPATVSTLTRDLAAWLCYLLFREVRDLNTELDPVYLRYKGSTQLLMDLQNGKAVLPDLPGGDPTESGTAVIAINETCDLINEWDFDLTRRWSVWP